MPRAKLIELRGYLTTSSVADALGLSPYLVKARIADGTLPPATRVSDAGVLLFDDEWLSAARDVLSVVPRRRRRRGNRVHIGVPSPERVLGHTMGESGWLPEWADIVRYFEEIERASDRVRVEELGTTTGGKPYIAVYISSPENLQPSSLERNRELLEQLWDPRGLNREETDLLVSEARSVAIVLATQHSNEIGAALMTLDLAYELITQDDPATQSILQNTITVLIPSHNPDGVQMIAEWYAKWLGTEYEGIDLPWLYHLYTGHDNNRDWFMMTQAETKLYAELHNREHPQAVFDMHQMGRKGVRFMVPPFIDPLDPNQDPVIQQGFAALGSHIAQRLT
ncbi:MAG TPA: M14 family zinc carboxypeptidase, partial [Thermomicrobiales bacterium]|nr:M14 family zinc carboxypeptidase [Thermomicrobiales bacterium]